jgi:hypothetical protein
LKTDALAFIIYVVHMVLIKASSKRRTLRADALKDREEGQNSPSSCVTATCVACARTEEQGGEETSDALVGGVNQSSVGPL